ncbi:MAG TPA: DUF433 domain-containing protein [Planctomycetota bacterium]|nr:DUF433 domain-containing protein [Planctomycetota bacterium]
MELPERIAIDPSVRGGSPVVAGTRIPVYAIVELAAAGKDFDEIRRDHYPSLTEQDIRACLEYAARVLKDEDLHAA